MIARKITWASRVMIPANTEAMTMVRTSRLRMCVSSWPSTASSSSLFSVCISPRVTVTAYCFCVTPLAKAFRASVSMMCSPGIGRPREMQRFSSRL